MKGTNLDLQSGYTSHQIKPEEDSRSGLHWFAFSQFSGLEAGCLEESENQLGVHVLNNTHIASLVLPPLDRKGCCALQAVVAEVEAEQPAAEVGSGFGSFWRIHAGNTPWAHSVRVHHFVLRVPARFNSQKVKDEAALFAVLFGTSETEKLNKLVKQPIFFFWANLSFSFSLHKNVIVSKLVSFCFALAQLRLLVLTSSVRVCSSDMQAQV